MIELDAGQKAMVAGWIATLEGNPQEKRPADCHAYAMEQFKRLYEIRDGAWVRKTVKTQEAFKTVAGKKRPASDFLVVTDNPSEWALPVKVNGKVDHQLMGEAWVALHEGPNNTKALSKLKALYRKEEMPLPTEEVDMIKFTEDEQFTDAVIIEKDDRFYHAPFKDAALAPLGEWREVVRQWVFVEVETQEVDFAESGVAVNLSEAAATESEPLVMDVCLIQPGWGNAKDKHYYPKEMLKREAHKFIGAHQFEKDHTDDKTSRDYVSTIVDIVGETPEGGPIAKVVVHDPGFAERMRLLDKAGLLKEMPCSIMAGGIATEKEIDGKKGMQVESITKVHAVDWVTAAGAGGHALAISEQEASMDEEPKVTEDVVESVDGTEVVLAEEDAEPVEPETAEPEASDETPESDEDKKDDEVEPLTGEEVAKALEGLPTAAQAKLKERKYKDAEELAEVVRMERAYISDLTEAGKPFAQGSSKAPNRVDLAEVEKRQDAVNARFLSTRGTN